MSRLDICRMCLCSDRRMYSIMNTALLGIWELLANSRYDFNDGKPQQICYLCYAYLKKTYQLQQRILKAERKLMDIFKNCLEMVILVPAPTYVSLQTNQYQTDDYNLAIAPQYRIDYKEGVMDFAEGDTGDKKTVLFKDEEIDSLSVLSDEKQDGGADAVYPGKDNTILSINALKEKVEKSRGEDLKGIKLENIDQVLSDENQDDVMESLDTDSDEDTKLSIDALKKKMEKIREEEPRKIILKEIVRESSCEYQMECLKEEDVESDTDLEEDTLAGMDALEEQEPRKIILTKIDHGPKLDVEILILSKEEQMEEMEKRKRSSNYKYSPFKCEFCYKGFINTTAFENHKKRHAESSGKYECDVCHMKYRSKGRMWTHIRHAHQKRYKCRKCPVICLTAHQAKAHNMWHDGYTYECELCNKKFSKPTSYLSHVRMTHSTDDICNICGDSFIGEMGLMMHKARMHPNANQNEEESSSEYFCNGCNLHFPTPEAWLRHMLKSEIHRTTKEDSVLCKFCQKTVPSHRALVHMKEHMRKIRKQQIVHPDKGVEGSFPCDKCDAVFTTRVKRSIHIKKTHFQLDGNHTVCEVCGMKFSSVAKLKYHQRIHTGEKPYECEHCEKRFREASQMRLHSRIHTGEKPYQCGQCDMRFRGRSALTRHLRIHTGSKPYQCQYCFRAFNQSNSLKGHIQTVHLRMPTVRKKRRHEKAIIVQSENVS